MTVDESPFLYINITILDASEAIKAKVAKKMMLPAPLKEKLATGMSKGVNPSKIAKEMGGMLCEKMPQELLQKGLTVDMEDVFQEGPFFVIQMKIRSVDMKKMERAKRLSGLTNYPEMPAIDADPKDNDDDVDTSLAATLMDWSLKLVGVKNQEKLENEILPRQIQTKIEAKLQELLGTKLEEQHIKTDVEIVKEESQARFFFKKLKEVRIAEAG